MANTTQKPDQENLDPAKDVGQDGFDEIVDKNFSPGDEAMMEERAASGLEDQEKNAATDTASAEDLSQAGIEQREESGDSTWQNNTSAETPPKKGSFFSVRRNRNIAVGVFGTIFVVMGLFATLGPSTAIVHLKEVMFDKFDGPFSSYMEKRNNRLFAKKISKDFTTGCTIKIKCRFNGMTSREIRKFEKRNPGTKIITEGRTIAGKRKVASIQFVDDDGGKRTVTAGKFRSVLKSSASLRNTVRNYNKPTVAHWWDASAGKFYGKYKIYRGKLKPASDTESKGKNELEKRKIRIRELIRESVAGKLYDNLNSARQNTEASAAEDAVKDQVSGSINEEAQKISDSMEDPTKAIDPTPKVSGPGVKNAGKAIAKAGLDGVKGAFLGPINGVNKACAAKRLIAAVGYTAKFINVKKLVAYSMIFMVAADQIKAGDADGDTAEQIGDLGSILSSRDPETGGTFSDSMGYQYAADGRLVQDPDTKKIDTGQIFPYIAGGGLAGSLLTVANQLDEIPGIKKGCKILDNTMVQITAGAISIVSVAFGFGSVSGLVLSASAGLAFAVAETIATPLLARAVAGAIVTGDEFGQDAGNAITSGFSAASSMMARFHGAFPLSKAKALAYSKSSGEARSQVAHDSSAGNYSEDSTADRFKSKLAVALLPLSQNAASGNFTKLSLTPLSSMQKISRNVAAADNGKEYEICEDSDYKKLDVAADPFCNPRYGLDPGIANAEEGSRYDADKVIEYMCGSSVDNEASCSDDAYIDNDGNPQGDYADWIEDCAFSDQPITAAGDSETPKECLDPEKTDDPVKYMMFRTYKNDSDINDQYEDRDANSGSTESTDSSVDGDVKQLAQELLDNPNVTFPYEDTRGVTAEDVLKEVVKTGKGIVNSPDVNITRVAVSVNMLKALVEYAKSHKIGINPITNADHSSTSNHYKGIAVDLDCNPPLDRAAFETIAAKYGGKNNGEVCPANKHWHYDFPED